MALNIYIYLLTETPRLVNETHTARTSINRAQNSAVDTKRYHTIQAHKTQNWNKNPVKHLPFVGMVELDFWSSVVSAIDR